MTSYRERHLAGLYGGEVDTGGKTLAELKAEAEELGLKTYGTKAELAERIAEAQAAPPAEEEPEE